MADDAVPWSEEAEQSVLGGILLDNRTFDLVSGVINAPMFFDQRHRAIYGAAQTLMTRGLPVDVITVYEHLKDAPGQWKPDIAYLSALAQGAVSAAHSKRYAEIVLEKWRDRAVRMQADAATAIAAGPGDSAQKLARIVAAFDALERGAVAQTPSGMASIMADLLQHTSDMAERGEPPGWSTRLPGLDHLLGGGFQPGNVYLLGARPGKGKSALALWWQLNLALKDALPCCYLSQEMGKREVGQRAVACAGKISYRRLRTGQLEPDEWSALSVATERLAGAPLTIDDQAGLSAGDVRIKARYIKGVKVLVLDYIQLCKGAGEGETTRNAELEEISRSLKTLAKDLSCAVVVLSALNRKVDDRSHQRPIMGDLKDCGALEADADVILTLYDIRAEPSTNSRIVGIDVLKNRQGEIGSVALMFWGDNMAWGESEFKVSELLKDTRKRGPDL